MAKYESMTDVDPMGLLLDHEQKYIRRAFELRENIIENFIDENGPPTKVGEMRIMNEMINSQVGQVESMYGIRKGAKDAESTGDIKDLLVEVFNKLDTSTRNNAGKRTTTVIEDKYIPEDIVPGETSTDYEEIELTDIINK